LARWRATLNGSAAPIERANHLFRAVRVAAGAWTVRFAYRPESLRRGALASFASSLLLAGLLVRSVRRPERV